MPTGKNKKVLVAVAAVGLLVVAYMFLRPKTPAIASPSSDGTAGTIPQTSSDAAGSQDSASADLLAALAGENQSLMKSFLASSSGLVSLAGSSLGSPGANSSAGEPSGGGFSASTTSTPFDLATIAGPDPTAPSSPSSTDPVASTLTAPTAPFATPQLLDQIAAASTNPAAGSENAAAWSSFANTQAPGAFANPNLINDISAAAANPLAGSQNQEAWAAFSGGTGPTVVGSITPGPNLGLGAVDQSKPGSGSLAA